MNMPYQRGPKGVRGDRKSGSKESNLTQFQPYWSSTETMYFKYVDQFLGNPLPEIFIDPTHKDFIMPICKVEIPSLSISYYIMWVIFILLVLTCASLGNIYVYLSLKDKRRIKKIGKRILLLNAKIKPLLSVRFH